MMTKGSGAQHETSQTLQDIQTKIRTLGEKTANNFCTLEERSIKSNSELLKEQFDLSRRWTMQRAALVHGSLEDILRHTRGTNT